MCNELEEFVAKLCGLAVEAKKLGLEVDEQFNTILSASYREMHLPTGSADSFNDGSVVCFQEAARDKQVPTSSPDNYDSGSVVCFKEIRSLHR